MAFVKLAPEPVEQPAPKKQRTPTDEQSAIIGVVAGGDSLVVKALAGTGKTTTMEMCAESIPGKKICYIAFNATVAHAGAKRFSSNVTSLTAHAAALRSPYPGLDGKTFARIYLPRVLPALDVRRKIEDALRLQIDQLRSYTAGSHGGRPLPRSLAVSAIVDTLANFCRSDEKSVLPDHVPYDIRMIIAGEGSSSVFRDSEQFSSLAAKAAGELWCLMADPMSSFPVYHDVYLKAWELLSPQLDYDVLFFDEAQDGNPVMLSIVKNQSSLQRVLVGDRHQAIYGWRGAKNAMDAFPEFAELPLTASWRYGQLIADQGQKFLDAKGDSSKLLGLAAHECVVHDEDGGMEADAILCRTNAGLITEALKLAQSGSGKKFKVVGGIKSALDMIRAAWAMKRGEQIPFCPEFKYFSAFENPWEMLVEVSKTNDGQQFSPIVSFVEKYSKTSVNIDSMIGKLESLAVDGRTKGVVELSTAHKAKGMEWGAVKISSDFQKSDIVRKMPPEFEPTKRNLDSGAYRLDESSGYREWYRFDEELCNLCYVTVTRAEKSLYGNGVLAHFESSLKSWMDLEKKDYLAHAEMPIAAYG